MGGERSVLPTYDELTGHLERFVATNGPELASRSTATLGVVTEPLLRTRHGTRSRVRQFAVLRNCVSVAIGLFERTCARMPKDVLMAVARRAPASYTGRSDLVLATLIAKYGRSDRAAGTTVRHGRSDDHHIPLTDADFFDAIALVELARMIHELTGDARAVGKGGRITFPEAGGFRVEAPAGVMSAMAAYERRRPRFDAFGSSGVFDPLRAATTSTGFVIPGFRASREHTYIEAPIGSGRRLLFNRLFCIFDGGPTASLLRSYDDAIRETWNVGAEHILHFLTAVSLLIAATTPTVGEDGENVGFEFDEDPDAFAHRLRFTFDLANKGFLRMRRATLVARLGSVETPAASTAVAGERLVAEFIDAFAIADDRRNDIDPQYPDVVPLLHPSDDGFLYVDLLLALDFLVSVIERCKEWYASQHGDRFVLNLKRWLDAEAPGAVVGARIPVRLGKGIGDVDLLVKTPTTLFTVECKAYGKSRDFMLGAPRAVSERRRRIREAVLQADRTAEAFARTTRPSLPVRGLVCTPSVEFLMPLDEHGLVDGGTPRVLTPEELLRVARQA